MKSKATRWTNTVQKSPRDLLAEQRKHCKDCETPRSSDICPALHDFMKALEEKVELQAYRDTGLEPDVCANYKQFEDEAVSDV